MLGLKLCAIFVAFSFNFVVELIVKLDDFETNGVIGSFLLSSNSESFPIFFDEDVV